MDTVVQRNSRLKKLRFLLASVCVLLTFSSCSISGTTKPFLVSGTTAFDSLPNRPLLVHFWSSWCRLCLSELYALNSLNEFATKNDVVIVAVAINDSLSAAMKIHRLKLQDTIVLIDDGSLEKKFKVPAVPFTVALDKNRNIIPIPQYPSGKLAYGISGAQPWGSAWGEKIINAIH